MHFLQKGFKSTFMGSKLKPHIISIHAPPLTIVQSIPASVVQEAIKISTAWLCLLHSF